MFAVINLLSTITGMYMSAIAEIAEEADAWEDMTEEQFTNNVSLCMSSGLGSGLGWDANSYVQSEVRRQLEAWLNPNRCPF